MGKKGGRKKKGETDAQKAERLKKEQEADEEQRLKEQVTVLYNKCIDEEKNFHKFLMEREKINYFWIVEKKTLSEKQADLRNKQREMQDLEERQQIELKMFQQRLKHLRYHMQDEVVELKTDAELALKLQEDHHRVTEAEIKKDKRGLKVEMKEMENAQEEFGRMLKLQQDQKILELRQDFDRQARDMQQKYEKRMHTIREDMEKQRRKETSKIEEAKCAHKERVMMKNQKDFQEIKMYYTEITSRNLDLIKHLKDEHQQIKKEEEGHKKDMDRLEKKNKQLTEPLKQAKKDVERLEGELEKYEADKLRLKGVKGKISGSETQLRRMEFQHEVLQQQLSHVNSERDVLYSKFKHSIYDVQQKAGLKNLLLEKKIDAVDEALETTEASVAELMTSANMDPATTSGISQKLDQVLKFKNEIVDQLQEEVQRIKDSHRTMVRTYESKLSEYGVPPEELGFTPAVAAA